VRFIADAADQAHPGRTLPAVQRSILVLVHPTTVKARPIFSKIAEELIAAQASFF
jgi:hypothetical protein